MMIGRPISTIVFSAASVVLAITVMLLYSGTDSGPYHVPSEMIDPVIEPCESSDLRVPTEQNRSQTYSTEELRRVATGFLAPQAPAQEKAPETTGSELNRPDEGERAAEQDSPPSEDESFRPARTIEYVGSVTVDGVKHFYFETTEGRLLQFTTGSETGGWILEAMESTRAILSREGTRFQVDL